MEKIGNNFNVRAWKGWLFPRVLKISLDRIYVKLGESDSAMAR